MVKTERQARLCDDLSAAADKSQWLEALREVMRAFGYAYVTLLRLPGGQNVYALPTVVESSLPIWVVNAMTKEQGAADEVQVTEQVQNLVPGAFVGEPERVVDRAGR